MKFEKSKAIFVCILLFKLVVLQGYFGWCQTIDKGNLSIEATQLIFDKNTGDIIANKDCIVKVAQYVLKADKILYRKDKYIYAEGSVVLIDDSIHSTYLLKNATVDLEKKQINLVKVDGNIENAKISAKNIHYNSDGLYIGDYVTTSVCNLCKEGKKIQPLWQLRAKKITTNLQLNEEVKLHDVYLDVLNKQIFYVPYLSLPAFWTGGKTGFLTPTLKDRGLGYQLEVPFYWNPKKNLDFTFYPSIGKKTLYGFNMRHKLKSGGYEVAIYTGQLPFVKNDLNTNINSIFRLWPANIRINANTLYSLTNSDIRLKNKVYELGIDGEIALGAEPILLYKYDISDKKILAGRVYTNALYNNSFLSIDNIHFHDLLSKQRLITLPKIDFYQITTLEKIDNFLPINTTLTTSLSTNYIHNEIFSRHISDILGEIKLIVKTTLNGDNRIIYGGSLVAHKLTYNTSNSHSILLPNFYTHFTNKGFNIGALVVEPHFLLHTYGTQNTLYQMDDYKILNDDDNLESTPLNIYTTTHNINPNDIFTNSLYTSNNRSILFKSGTYLDYGMNLMRYDLNRGQYSNKFILTLVSRKYFHTKVNQNLLKIVQNDLRTAAITTQEKEKYALQLLLQKDNLLIINRSWFSNKTQITNSELYVQKAFKNFETGFEFFYFNSDFYFETIKKYDKILKTYVKYNITNNLSASISNGIKFGQNAESKQITKIKNVKLNMEYANECAIFGFTIKKEFDNKTHKNSNVNTYALYFRIPNF